MLEIPLGHALEGVRQARASNGQLRGVLALSWGDVHGCRACDLRAYCRRCHAAALAEVGDALAPYPSACAEARALYELATGHEPRVVARGDRDGSVGPYREREPATFEPFADVVTAGDEALALRLGWTRRTQRTDAAPATAHPGALVQIRRPGRATARAERVPSCTHVPVSDTRGSPRAMTGAHA
jgi:hypothetical protein